MLQHEAEYIDARPLTTNSSNLLATHGRTIHLGQKHTLGKARLMSALPPKADMVQHDRRIRFSANSGRTAAQQKWRSASCRRPGLKIKTKSADPAPIREI